ncbi:multicopper oxidase family protein [Cryobacterium psychrophilum]|uniref:multicopper oxidase family protein n=1 Tax=Cryobacterium psychrophilum TaxID=41988 RepID=UPI001F547490|nr:multicopper oxidase family protein [Cryobacterium psychrophilum]
MRAGTGTLDLAGTTAPTWSYGSIPSPIIRLKKGDALGATIENALPEPTSIHWHGVALRNDMDGVPNLTQKAIAAGSSFRYQFHAPHAGTYWFHPHVGTQLDRGLYGALIVEDPKEPLAYDDEWVVILDDWLDGVTATPPEVLADLSKGMGYMDDMGIRMGNMLMGAKSNVLGGDAGDVYYPHYLINGRPPADPETYASAPGKRVRIRLINAGGDTAFRVALAGHHLTVTHTEGFPVDPVEVDSVLLGMGERYDVIVAMGDGVFAFVAEAEGKQNRAFAVVRTSAGTTPPTTVIVPELSGRLATVDKLRAASDVALPTRSPDRELTIRLRGSMTTYNWSLDGRRFSHDNPMNDAHPISAGERVRVNFVNTTEMWHPMHLHGHTYQHSNGGPRKDTSIVLPGRTLSVDFDADNPGRWLTDCHNLYHGEAGMMGVLAYTN